jgi:site-specific DNA-methyltransferase (adenine-specific)
LLCGDSTDGQQMRRVMDGELAAAVITDPPYGVSYVGKTSDALPVHNDGAETLLPLLDAALTSACELCVAGGCWYVAAPAGPQFFDFATVLTKLGIWRQTLVWVKHALVLGRSDYHYQHEAIFHGWKPGADHRLPPDYPEDKGGDFRTEHGSIVYGWKPDGPHQPPPDRKQTTLWCFDRPAASREHPTMKPVALFERMIANSTQGGALVLEPFMGSGTTLIACERLGRRCFGLEISPQYCDVIVKRWENFTGQKAQLASAGNSHGKKRKAKAA